MNIFKMILIILCVMFVQPGSVLSKSSSMSTEQKATPRIHTKGKGAVAVPGAFRVKTVLFKKVSINNVFRLAAAVIFNRNLNPSTVMENGNIRMIKKNENHFWVDASTQNNAVRIGSHFITWVSGATLTSGFYKMILRGTIESSDGVYLDCDGDGKGEGGYLPAYESPLFEARINELDEITLRDLEDLIDRQ